VSEIVAVLEVAQLRREPLEWVMKRLAILVTTAFIGLAAGAGFASAQSAHLGSSFGTAGPANQSVIDQSDSLSEYAQFYDERPGLRRYRRYYEEGPAYARPRRSYREEYDYRPRQVYRERYRNRSRQVYRDPYAGLPRPVYRRFPGDVPRSRPY
jgi:hypothetical protein